MEQPVTDGPVQAEAVLAFWFGALDADGAADAEHTRRWFSKDSRFDDTIRVRFQSLHASAATGGCDDWLQGPRGTLAFVILLDQFSRNMFRGTAEAFAQDARALEAAGRAVDAGFDRRLRPSERGFLYMPFMHSEELTMQDRCVQLFADLRDQLAGPAAAGAAQQLDYARRHRDIIQRFGRFPHRNAALGRPSTAEEEAYLAGPGSSF